MCHRLWVRAQTCSVVNKISLHSCHSFDFCLGNFFKNTKNLFIHIARIPIGDSPRVHPNIFKMSPPFASSEGYSASGVRYQSDGECVTHLLPHS